MIVPWALPSVIIGLVWTWMLDFNLGLINTLGLRWGLLDAPVAWLAQPGTAMLAVILAVVWQGFPFFAITLLAGLQGIPKELYEAAEIDGASTFNSFRNVTLPSLAPVIATALLLRMIWVANSLDLILVMTGGGPSDSTNMILYYIYQQAEQNLDLGLASAATVVCVGVLLALALLSLRRLERGIHYES